MSGEHNDISSPDESAHSESAHSEDSRLPQSVGAADPSESSRRSDLEDAFGSIKVNVSEGDYIGRDNSLFSGTFGKSVVMSYRPPTLDQEIGASEFDFSTRRVSNQLSQLRGRITKLIPTEETLQNLAGLRRTSKITQDTIPNPVQMPSGYNTPKDYLARLSDIETRYRPGLDNDEMEGLLDSLSSLADDVNLRISRLNSFFVTLVYPAATSKELVENMVSKIGNHELREEAQMHLSIVEQLAAELEEEELTDPELDVLSAEAQAAMGVMTELEKRRLNVESLVQKGRKKTSITVGVVIGYIALFIALMAGVGIYWGPKITWGGLSLNELRMPLLGVPWPVFFWSLIGSFAAMIHRFNRRPIHDFGDAVKWMLTRPVQGVVLGSAFYLVLVSGLFLLTGGNVGNSSDLIVADEIILVLSFLVGFSDRFADSVFNALVEKYSSITKKSGDQETNDA